MRATSLSQVLNAWTTDCGIREEDDVIRIGKVSERRIGPIGVVGREWRESFSSNRLFPQTCVEKRPTHVDAYDLSLEWRAVNCDRKVQPSEERVQF
jgi:hypothetical protein